MLNRGVLLLSTVIVCGLLSACVGSSPTAKLSATLPVDALLKFE